MTSSAPRSTESTSVSAPRGLTGAASPLARNDQGAPQMNTPTNITAAAGRPRLMTPEELADYIGVTLHCVYAWSSRGGGPRPLKVGGRLRYRPADVEAWLDGTYGDDRKAG